MPTGCRSIPSTSGAIGVALRHVASGAYVSFHARSEDGSQAWETIVLDAAALESLVEPGQSYTLDFIDSYHGGWGWVGAGQRHHSAREFLPRDLILMTKPFRGGVLCRGPGGGQWPSAPGGYQPKRPLW